MFIGTTYILAHIAALVAAMLLATVRFRWLWIPYLCFLLLEAFLLWRVQPGELFPVWGQTGYTMVLAAIVFGAPVLRLGWHRKKLWQVGSERRLAFAVLILQLTCLIWATSASWHNHQENRLAHTLSKIRSFALADQRKLIEQAISAGPKAPSRQLKMRAAAIKDVLKYGVASDGLLLAKRYPEAINEEHLWLSLQKENIAFFAFATQEKPELLTLLSQKRIDPLATALATGNTKLIAKVRQAVGMPAPRTKGR